MTPEYYVLKNIEEESLLVGLSQENSTKTSKKYPLTKHMARNFLDHTGSGWRVARIIK